MPTSQYDREDSSIKFPACFYNVFSLCQVENANEHMDLNLLFLCSRALPNFIQIFQSSYMPLLHIKYFLGPFFPQINLVSLDFN